MAGGDDGGNEKRRDGSVADAPQETPATEPARPVPGKTTLIEQQLTGGGARPEPQKVGQQSLIERESGRPAPPGPEAFGALAALVGAPRPTAGDAAAAAKHKHPAHPHAHDHKPAMDAINSDDGQNVTRADLLAVEPQEIHFGRVPYRAGAEPTEAAPYLVTITNPTGDPINVEDIRPDLAAEFPIFSADSTETAIPPGGTLRFRVGFRPHRVGVQSTTIHVIARGTSMARVFATGHAEPEGGHWEALHLSTQRIEFPETAIGQESAPKPIRITNRSGVPVRIEDIAPVKGKGDQFAVYEAGGNEIAAGDSIEMSLAFRPTRRGSLDATFQVRTAGATEMKDLPGGTIHARGFAADAVEANADAVREGRDVGPVNTYDEMLAALQAAQQFTEAGAGNDGHSHENYDRAQKLVAPVAARLDQLAQKLPEFANTMGFASTGTRLDFGYAHDDVRIWARLLRPSGGDGTPTINPQPYMLAFEQAKEIIQVLTGEQKDAPTLRTLGSAAKWTPLEITGAAVAGGAVAWGGTEVAAVIGEGAAASPSVASITTTMMSEWQNARYAFSIAFGWIATHPDEANELTIWLGSIGVSIVDAGGVKEFFNQIQDWESFINIFGQMADPVVNHEHAMNARRAAEADPMGVEPTTYSTGPRPATNATEGEPTESTGGARQSSGSRGPTAEPTGAARALARARALIDRVKAIAGRARGSNTGASESEQPQPSAPKGTTDESTVKPESSTAGSAPGSSNTTAEPQPGRMPANADDARALKAAGEKWSNKEIRDYYNAQNRLIPALDQEWIRQGKSAAERARLAFEHRHGMRMTAREMMGDPALQLDLLVRDAQKYGDGEGPTFEQLVEQQRASGKEGDAAYEAIISGAERTDAKTNARVQKGDLSAPAIDLPPGVTVHGDVVAVRGTNDRTYRVRITRGGGGDVETIRKPDGEFEIRIGENVPPEAALRQVARALREFADTPRQGSDDLGQLYADAAVAQQELGELTRSVASDLGGRALVPEKLKGRARAQEKIGADYQGENARITDLARSTIEFDHPQQIEKAVKEIGARAEIVRIKDRFKKPIDGYRDVMMNVRMQNGHIVEVQLHLKAILDVKNGPGHPLYEEIRAIDARAKLENRPRTATEDARREELVKEMSALYDQAYEASLHQGDDHGN